ncbi:MULTISPECIES: peptidylprolyl isomerase [Butyricimonas]|uniref:peptidylprolyl isomerase n=1 Tax=Butyricimonas TaxID=574697 RepID=UPI000366383C|nr:MULTISPECIES: peptidylprolyl isomerase [Butyricimonas]
MRYLSLLILLFLASYASAQKNVIDKIIAVVGEEIVLKSDIENDLLHAQTQSAIANTADAKAQIFENRLVSKLLMAQAKIDSITVSDSEVEAQLNSQLELYIQNIGSREKLEGYFGKSYEEIKNEMRTPLREQMITGRMQQKIVENVRVTPSEVRYFYRKFNKDSLPEVGDKYEIQQIVIKPRISDTEKERIRNRLRQFRDDILEGKQSFNTLAVLYSEDPGTAAKGGELGYMSKSQLTPEFAEAAFSLKPGRISKIVESEYGFHIIQYIDRQGDKVNVRHILLRPRIEESDREAALQRLDSVVNFIKNGELTFEQAAYLASSDKKTRNNGGLIFNPYDADSKLPKELIKGDMARQVSSLQVGEISEPFLDRTETGDEYKIIKIKAYYPAHTANLDDDWLSFENGLKRKKEQEIFEKWIKERQENTYIHIDDEYKNIKFHYDGWIK